MLSASVESWCLPYAGFFLMQTDIADSRLYQPRGRYSENSYIFIWIGQRRGLVIICSTTGLVHCVWTLRENEKPRNYLQQKPLSNKSPVCLFSRKLVHAATPSKDWAGKRLRNWAVHRHIRMVHRNTLGCPSSNKENKENTWNLSKYVKLSRTMFYTQRTLHNGQ